MGVVLKTSLLNEGFDHYKNVTKTILVLCVERDDGNPNYFVNVRQSYTNGNDQTANLARRIRDVDQANKVFEDLDKALALEGFGLSHAKGQNSLKQTTTAGQDPGSTPEDVEKQRKEDLVRDLVEGLDDSLD